jgi:hypothetical protein
MKIISASVTTQFTRDSANPHIRFRSRPIAPTTRSAPKTPLIAIIRYRCSGKNGTMNEKPCAGTDWSTPSASSTRRPRKGSPSMSAPWMSCRIAAQRSLRTLTVEDVCRTAIILCRAQSPRLLRHAAPSRRYCICVPRQLSSRAVRARG